jgi:hypothetical protein
MAQPSQSQYVEQPRFCESCPLCITGKSHPARLPVPSGLHVRASHENLRRLFRSARAAQCVTTKRDPDRSRGLPVSAGNLARTHDPHHQRKGCEDWSGQHPAPSQYYQTKKIPTRRLRLRAASCALPARSWPRGRPRCAWRWRSRPRVKEEGPPCPFRADTCGRGRRCARWALWSRPWPAPCAAGPRPARRARSRAPPRGSGLSGGVSGPSFSSISSFCGVTLILLAINPHNPR